MSSEIWSRLIDYAGVFPPAERTLTDALTRYARATAGPDGWVLGPCLIRASQLGQLERHMVPSALGIVLDQPVSAGTPIPIAQVETVAVSGGVTRAVRPALELSPVVYVEAAGRPNRLFLEEVAGLRAGGNDVRAKIRTGGSSAAFFPTVEEVAGFIETCVELAVPFKATAGLHHPFRSRSTVDEATEHGYINVLAAVRSALVGDGAACRMSLEEHDPTAFDVTTAVWRGVGADVAAKTVRETFRSFGSCSFNEPVGYLRDLGVLPVETVL
ncbi:MAG: hypothetical protein WBV06_13255 [Acidimicrobiia bacterium]